jgi:protein-disulfide isomerase
MLRRFTPLLAVFIAALAAGYWLIQPDLSSPTAEFDLPFAANAESSSASDTETSYPVITEMVLGSEDAPITVIEYASFTCSHCANFHKDVYKHLKKNYIDTNKVKFEFREVYFHKYGLWASLVARCAGPEKFFPLTKEMLETQSKWSRVEGDLAVVKELKKIGLKVGMGEGQLKTCLADVDKMRALVEWSKDNRNIDEINSTPSFIIDGEPYSNMSYEDLSKLLDEKLES